MRTNFIHILSDTVEIPIIQRDYAQGRTDHKTNKIRKDFLTVLFDFIAAQSTQLTGRELELDFIYGFNDARAADAASFIPIDGQQRLTTLWLLYWLVAAKEKIVAAEQVFLANFIYETRHSTTEFCTKLIAFRPEFNKEDISQEIKNQSWFFETWSYDPSVQAMLIVLKDMEERYAKLGITPVWPLIAGSACPFYFYKLDMEKVGLTDDLYIKMNSRGKALTEFEYFKAGFTEILTDEAQKERFNHAVDQDWIDGIWQLVLSSGYVTEQEDIALKVDQCFLNLFNFITSVIAFQQDILDETGGRYKDTEVSGDLLAVIYQSAVNQNILFDTLDAVCRQQRGHSDFWENLFYVDKNDFDPRKVRLYFQHGKVNLLERCLFNFDGSRGFSYPEQILLYACLTHLKSDTDDFEHQIRIIRNLVANSDSELREANLGKSFTETADFVLNNNLAVFQHFKTDQIEEEKQKAAFQSALPGISDLLKKLEDSDIFRGSVSLLPLDETFSTRAVEFLHLFDEEAIINDFAAKSNLLLRFGDYSQDHNGLTNLMSANKGTIRDFLTLPGFNKEQFYTKTQKVMLQCLDHFIMDPKASPAREIKESTTAYKSSPKDWIYYFLTYPSFRYDSTKGYYKWGSNDYNVWKMRVKQFNGYHWDPFLYELAYGDYHGHLTLNNYGDKMLLIVSRKKVAISSLADGKGFAFENAMSAGADNTLLETIFQQRIINKEGFLLIRQDEAGYDLEDRIKKLSMAIKKILDIVKG